VVGVNSGTEVTDYVVPYAILSASGVADVWALGTRPGPIPMFPALTIEPQATVGAFDARFPRGADVVIVPAAHDDEDPELLSWITTQANRGATIVGVCDGVWVLARAGLLSGWRAVGHWYSMGRLQNRFPETTWVRDRRYVADGHIVTTTGVTASTPVSLALVEAIAGRAKADSLAHALGVRSWSPDHDSDHFSLSVGYVRTAAANWLAFWGREEVGIPVYEGVDEIALALTADAYSRTYRSSARSVAATDTPVTTRRGLRILPDVVSPTLIAKMFPGEGHGTSSNPESQEPVPVANGDPVDYLVPMRADRPVRALDDALASIGRRYGERTAAFVALQLEYAP
jgi:putative intracellular protease/amidase